MREKKKNDEEGILLLGNAKVDPELGAVEPGEIAVQIGAKRAAPNKLYIGTTAG